MLQSHARLIYYTITRQSKLPRRSLASALHLALAIHPPRECDAKSTHGARRGRADREGPGGGGRRKDSGRTMLCVGWSRHVCVGRKHMANRGLGPRWYALGPSSCFLPAERGLGLCGDTMQGSRASEGEESAKTNRDIFAAGAPDKSVGTVVSRAQATGNIQSEQRERVRDQNHH